MRGLKLFIKEKFYRKAVFEILKWRFLSLPLVKDMYAYILGKKFEKKIQGNDNWDQYVAIKKAENDSKIFRFKCDLVRLEAYIMADGNNEELFRQAKSDVLNNEVIDWPEYREFKKWASNIDSSEKDYSLIEQLINSQD